MSPWRSLCTCLLLAALMSVPAKVGGQTFPSDDAGRPAPWCSYIDDSVTPAVSVSCSISRPLPSGGATPSIGTDLFGFGRTFFFGITGSSGAAPTTAPATTLFTDALTVVGLRQGIAGAGFLAYISNDGGRTFGPGVSTGFPAAGGANNPSHLLRTVSPTSRFVVSFTGNTTGSIAHSLSVGNGWAFATGAQLVGNVTYKLGAQGSNVLAVGPDAFTPTKTVACLSTNDGQAFPSCVTVDPNAASTPTETVNPIVASPATNIWLVFLNDGKVWRSADNAATWTTVLTAAQAGTLVCLSSTRCVAVAGSVVWRSNDAGLTWTNVGSLPSSSNAITICSYTATVFDVILSGQFPQTATQTTVPAFRTVDGGTSFVGSVVTGGTADVPSGPISLAGACSTTSSGRATFVVRGTSNLLTYYGSVIQNAAQLVGANGIPLAVDPSGNFTGNQGLPQATSPNAWGVVPVQGPALKNSTTTGAANTATTVTVAAVAAQRVHLHRVDAYCTPAGTATTLTVTDGGTVIWPGTPTGPTLAIGQQLGSPPSPTPANLSAATSAAGAAQSPTIAAVAGQRITVNTLTVFASAAGNVTVSLTDGTTTMNFGTVALGIGGTVLAINETFAAGAAITVNIGAPAVGVTTTVSAAGTIPPAPAFTQGWAPSLDSTTGNALTVTLGACGVGNSGVVTVHADQF